MAAAAGLKTAAATVTSIREIADADRASEKSRAQAKMAAKIERAATALWRELAFSRRERETFVERRERARERERERDVDGRAQAQGPPSLVSLPSSNFAVDLGDVARLCVSPSGDLAAVVVARAGEAGKKTMALEIWASDGALPGRVRASDAKGVALSAIYTDAQFGDLCWSADETMVAFVAEEAKGAEGQHDYEEDMGEQLEGKVLPRLYTVAVSRTRGVVGEPALVPPPVGQPPLFYPFCVGQPQLTVERRRRPVLRLHGLGVGAEAPRRHLLSGAPAHLYESTREGDEWGPPQCLTAPFFAVAHSPRVSPSGARAICLAHRNLPTTHMACQALVLVDLATEKYKGQLAGRSAPRVLLDEVRASAAGATFAGLYSPCTTARAWLSDSEVVFSESVRSRGRVLHLAIDDVPGGGPAAGTLSELQPPNGAGGDAIDDCRLVDVLPAKRRVLLSCSSPLVPHALYAGTVGGRGAIGGGGDSGEPSRPPPPPPPPPPAAAPARRSARRRPIRRSASR